MFSTLHFTPPTTPPSQKRSVVRAKHSIVSVMHHFSIVGRSCSKDLLPRGQHLVVAFLFRLLKSQQNSKYLGFNTDFATRIKWIWLLLILVWDYFINYCYCPCFAKFQFICFYNLGIFHILPSNPPGKLLVQANHAHNFEHKRLCKLRFLIH